MQIPIVSGIYTTDSIDIRTAYPKNLVPVPSINGVSTEYLKPADGLVKFADVPGFDRGGINWNNVLYRVCGSKLVKIDADGTVNTLGDVEGTTEQVTFTYSFDRLAIASNNKLWYYNTTIGLVEVTDPDIGTVLDVTWVDGYFMTTDGEYLVVSELSDPLSFTTTKYGSSEASPDPVKALLRLKNEIYALNRYTIEVFDNVGGAGFPFQRIESAQIDKGTIGTNTCCVFMDTIAFLGGGTNEEPSIWLGNNSQATKLSTKEIDLELSKYTEAQLAEVLIETRTGRDHRFLYVHLNDRTLVYDAVASQALQQPIWHVLTSNTAKNVHGFDRYRARNMVYCYDKWFFGDSYLQEVGYFDETISSHYGDVIEWEFSTPIIYNETQGAIVHEIELTALTGRVVLGVNPTIFTDYSLDGVTWSNKEGISAGTQGDRTKRLVWLQQGTMGNWRIQRFRGTSNEYISFLKLNMRIEPLYV